jgi:peptidoglycan/LPS O-acetylase OafA/YrhL
MTVWRLRFTRANASFLHSAKRFRTGPALDQNRKELDFAAYQASTYRPGFDGLRAIGFLLVVTAHIPAVALFSSLQGWSAVWVFFAISGYLVTMLLIREERKTGTIAFGPFMIRRFFRIVPAYAIAILLYWAALRWVLPSDGEYERFMARLPYYLTLMPEYAHTNVFTIFVHSWIIGIEAKFYLFFPPVVFLLLKRDRWRFGLTAATALVLAVEGSLTALSYCGILFGAMLAQLLEWPRSYAAIAALTRVPVAVPLACIAALLVLLRYREQWLAVTVVATYLVAYVVLQEGAMRRVLMYRPLVYLGQRSYGAYLLHVLAIHIGYMAFGSDTTVGGLLTAGLALAVTIPAAEVMYRLVERPAIELSRRLADRREKPVH